MALNEDHKQLLAALHYASQKTFEPTAGCPQGRSDWHGARRLLGWGLLEEHMSETYISRLGLPPVRAPPGHRPDPGAEPWLT